MADTPSFDVALSFAGEDRDYVDAVAHHLQARGVKVFYDLFAEADLWGKDLYVHLSDVYRSQARYTVMFISEHYKHKLWTNHERQAAQAKAFQEAQEYILPARFDDTEIPGVLPTVGYISLTGRTPEELVSLIVKKLVSAGGSVPTDLVRRDYGSSSFLPSPDPTICVVSVQDDEGTPIGGATVTAQADNGTTVERTSNAGGRCEIPIKTRRPYRLLISHPAFPAAIIEHVDPADGARVTLPRMDNVGSLLLNSTGWIPGLDGRLNPILDASGRTYLYADNIAINGGEPQPATFSVNEPIELEDADGVVVYATVKHIASRVALMQYTRRTTVNA